MLIRLATAFIIATAIYVALRMILRKKSLSVRQFFYLYAAVLLGMVFLYLGLTGRLHPLFVVLGVALPFLSRIVSWGLRGFQAFSIFRVLRGVMPGASAGLGAQNQISEINTRFLHMVLFHDTGMMDGDVLTGNFTGSKLSLLELAQLLELLRECQSDADSISVLQAYLDREHANWRDQLDPGSQSPPSASDGQMNDRQAYEILGLADDASRDDVVQAHRRLMQKLHPDRGGSTYLAAKINEAKERLLDKLGK